MARRKPGFSSVGSWLDRYAIGLGLLDLVFLVAVTTIIGGGGGLLNGPLTSLKLALALPIIATILTLAAVYVAARQWRTRAGTRGARLRYSGAVFVALLFTWSLAQWNLLGWRM